MSAAAAAREAMFFVHMLPRFVSDFALLANQLAESGARVTVFAPGAPARNSGAADPNAAPASGAAAPWWKRRDVLDAARARLDPAIAVETLPVQRDRVTLFGALRTAALAWRMGRRHPDAVFFLWTPIPFLFCGVPLRLLERRCVFMVTGLGTMFGSDAWRVRMMRPWVLVLYRYLFRAPASRVVVHNQEDKDFLVARVGLVADHVMVTPGCGVDPQEYPWIEAAHNPRPVIYAPVRLIPEKGVEDAVDASRILNEQGVEHELWFSSEIDRGNPMAFQERDLARLKSKSPCVRFLGHHPSVVPLYQQCDVMCMPTCYREGLPTAILESAACGRAMVATDNVGCREFVLNEDTGLIVPRHDPTALAAALRRLCEDVTLRERLRRRAYDAFRARFTKQIMVDRTWALIESLGWPLKNSRSAGAEQVELA